MRTFTRVANMSPGLRDTGDEIDAEHINVLQESVEDLQTGALPIALPGIAGALEGYGPIENPRSGYAYVLDEGAIPDATTDSYAAIQTAIDTGAGTIVFPATTDRFRVGTKLVPKKNQRFVAAGFQYVHASSSAQLAHIGGLSTYNGPIFELNGIDGVTFDGLIISGSGNTAHTSNVGIYAPNANYLTIKNCSFNNFAGPGIRWDQGVGIFVERCLTTNCALATGLSSYLGAVEIHGQDGFIQFNEFSSVGGGYTYDAGYVAAMYVKGGNNFILCNVCELSEVGIVLDNVDSKCFENLLMGNRADLNLGHGFVVAAPGNQFIGNRSYKNGLAATNTYDGFSTTGNRNTFVGNTVDNIGSDTVKMRDGFRDTSSIADSTLSNLYVGNKARSIAGQLYNVSDGDHLTIDFANRPTYTPTNVTTDRSFDADSTSTAELADVLGTLIADLKAKGLLT